MHFDFFLCTRIFFIMHSRYLSTATVHLVGTLFVFWILSYFTLPYYILTCCFGSFVGGVTLLIVANLTFRYTKKRYVNGGIHPQGKAVLITGCDYGFGHRLAVELDSKGFRVFACCLFPTGDGANELKKFCSERLEILELDVTKDNSVAKAKDYVSKNLGDDELWAIVNNAGILKGLSVDFSDIQDYQDCMQMNAIGTVRVTKAFLPFLKKSRGRIINLTSLVGRTTHPFMSPYIMSKFAAVAFTECLRQELDIWGIRVISVEPESYRAPIADLELLSNYVDQLFSSLPEDIRDDYGELYFDKLKKIILWYGDKASLKVHNVVTAIESAVSLKDPDDEYHPCRSVYFGILLYIYVRMPRVVRDSFLKFLLYYVCSLIPEKVQGSLYFNVGY